MSWFHKHKAERNLGVMYTNRGQYRECICGARQWGGIPPFGMYIIWQRTWEKGSKWPA